jgi:hypothetical protein
MASSGRRVPRATHTGSRLMEGLFDIFLAAFHGLIRLCAWRDRPGEKIDYPGTDSGMRPGMYAGLAKARTRDPCDLI